MNGSLELLAALVFLIASIATMAGLGGGLVYAPLLVLLGAPPRVAATTALLLNAIAATSAAIARRREVERDLVGPMAISAALLAPVGALLHPFLPPSAYRWTLAIITILAAIRLLRPGVARSRRTSRRLLGLSLGAVVGLMAGILGIGGGVLVVPLLMGLAAVTPSRAATTSLVVASVSSWSGFVAHASLETFSLRSAGILVLASIAGGQVGARIAGGKLSEPAQRRTMAAVFAAIGIGLISGAR